MTSQPTDMPGTVHRLGDDSCYDVKDKQAQDFVANIELLRSILNHTLLGILYVSSLCVLDGQSVAPTNSSLVVPPL
jgi:hypothetical protein